MNMDIGELTEERMVVDAVKRSEFKGSPSQFISDRWM